ncbi:ferric-dicitrate binding protein FerR, regulates iron transport through sigma-19 [Catalinimonas alkaloidigena]|uniref:Ferric-dicitrate binding protein FerR, regulates iron transport through sigma-19 n=1 Tax=Catalinimonas alkaloidigena TaxID=1075417 RepID=A0A1G9HK92_9BACT|nr:FecR domain-containing protein [Catalinimonas alkaloidigena]SDL13292.1 ferric-dicitrate binding protein FerR, regulates iron transport through sigma-19 [Catalinimonas alkaloidigena]
MKYTPEDLLRDPSFQQWILDDDPQAALQWERWLTAHPEQRAVVEAAALLLRGPQFKKPAFDARKTDADWRRLQAQLQANAPQMRPLRRTSHRWAYRVAAAMVVLLTAVGAVWWIDYTSYERLATAFGERQEVVLPDGSRVVLNANSRLRYTKDWQQATAREVWLDGEAFFKVAKQPTPAGGIKFVVHTDDLDVEVLGTEFNVQKRARLTEVTLEEGRIRLELHAPEAEQEVVLQPGDQVAYHPDTRQLERRQLKAPEHISAWQQGQLVLDQKTLGEVAMTLEDHFGKQVVFADQSLSQVRLSGRYPLDDLDRLLEALSVSAQMDIAHDNQRIVFRPMHP